MRWMSVDPADKTGLVLWDGATAIAFATLRPAGKREAKANEVNPARALALDVTHALNGSLLPVGGFASPMHAWTYLVGKVSAIVVEESFGESAKTVSQMGERRGYIEAVCDENAIRFASVNTMVWRKVCGERLDKSWPPASKAAKQRSIDLVREHCDGLVVTGDEGDAYWVGRAAMWLGLVTP